MLRGLCSACPSSCLCAFVVTYFPSSSCLRDLVVACLYPRYLRASDVALPASGSYHNAAAVGIDAQALDGKGGEKGVECHLILPPGLAGGPSGLRPVHLLSAVTSWLPVSRWCRVSLK